METPLNIAPPTKGSTKPNRDRYYRAISGLAITVPVAAGSFVLAGWFLGIRTFTSLVPNYATIKPNTAFCFVLAGVSLCLLRPPGRRPPFQFNPTRYWLGQICALLVAFCGLLTLGEYCFGLNLGIDQTLVRDAWTDIHISPPGRMSIATAFGFFMLGSSLFFLGRKSPQDAVASQILALGGLLTGLFACLSYVYGVDGLHSISLYTTMAVHTSLVLILLCLGALLAQPDRGLMDVFNSQYSGGQMARLILPLAFTLPLFIGWFRLQGERSDLYGTEFGLALFAASNIVIFTTLVWISAKSLNTRTARLAQARFNLEERIAASSIELIGARRSWKLCVIKR